MNVNMDAGWYNDPADSTACFWWDGKKSDGPYLKTYVLAAHSEAGISGNIFKDVPVEGGASAQTSPAAGWSYTKFPNNPNAPLLYRYSDGTGFSEYFDGDIVAEEVFKPTFIRHGGPESWFDEGCPQGPDAEMFQLVLKQITAEHARAIVGDTAPMYNNGPTWISDKDSPNLARWWDGNDFTGETELIGVIQQREFDRNAGTEETVSFAPGLPGTEAGSWHADPQDASFMIRWGGTRWDKKRSVEDTIAELFGALGEDVPARWSGRQVMSPRHAALIEQLTARKNGVNGWYKEPAYFDDLRMRVWHEGQWTNQVSQQQPGWYDDPSNDEMLRFWDGAAWTGKTTTKEAERIRRERDEARQQKRAAFKQQALVFIADYYSPEKSRQRRIDARNEESRRIRDAAAIEQAQFYRDRPAKPRGFWR